MFWSFGVHKPLSSRSQKGAYNTLEMVARIEFWPFSWSYLDERRSIQFLNKASKSIQHHIFMQNLYCHEMDVEVVEEVEDTSDEEEVFSDLEMDEETSLLKEQ